MGGGLYAWLVHGEDQISDAELTALALAADPDAVDIDDDAVPFGTAPLGETLLPSWYMPAPMAAGGRHRRRRTLIVGCIVAALIAVNGVGLCVTYGVPEVGDRIVSLW